MFLTSFKDYCRSIKLFPNIPNFYLFRLKRRNKDDAVLFFFRPDVLQCQSFIELLNLYSFKCGINIIRIPMFFLGKVVRLISCSLFRLTKHFPSLRKASRSNPLPIFLNCMRNDVTSVHRCLTTFRKKTIVYYDI